ncbi:MAG: hypothetical protein KAW61_08365, partial [candidate division Zixibacteria bacterium]|nr:hypothetical protein [candidate division Zixibacteria bacterium]
VLLDILKTNRWQRPVYISVGLSGRVPLGLQEYLRPDGLAWRVVADPAERRNLSALERNVLERFSYRGLGGEVLLDRESRNMTNNYRRAFAYLERFYNEQGNDTARERLQEIYHNLWPEE